MSICLLSLSLLAGGCTKKEEAPIAEATPEATVEATPEATPEATASPEADKPAAMLGGWTVYEDNKEYIAVEHRAVFDKALEGWTGVGYEPIALLATQVVSGTNYSFLAKGTTVTANPEVGYYIVTIYENLSGECEVLCIKGLDFTNPIVIEDAPGALVGGWESPTTGKPNMLSDQDIEASFLDATRDYEGLKFNPLAILGTQVVSGLNYCAICIGEATAQDQATGVYLVTWYRDTQGNSSITDVQHLDIGYYADPSVQ